MSKSKINLLTLQKMKKEKEPVAWITAYDLPFAYAAEQAGIDMILVGDSGGMVQLGHKTTNPVTMDEMIILAKAVRKGAPNTFVIGDMPQGSYEISNEIAIESALRFIKEADCDAIKLEGSNELICERIKAISQAGILTMGHLGLTPQSAQSFGGYKVQGKTFKSLQKILDQAKAIENAGGFSILLEAMPSISSKVIVDSLNIPVYGIGAGTTVDGQLIIMHDAMGFYQSFRPWFAKCYIPEVVHEFGEYIISHPDIRKMGREERKDGLLVLAELAIKKYIEEVKSNKFPTEEYSYPIKKEEADELKKYFSIISDYNYSNEEYHVIGVS